MATEKLTERRVAGAKADKGTRLELWDALTPGLALRVSDAGRKTWIVRYRRKGGGMPRFTLGTYPELGLAEARERASAATKEAKSGGDPAATRRREWAEAQAEPIKTMGELADAYFTACEIGEWQPRGKKKRATTLAEERGLWRRHIKAPLGALRLEEVGPDAIRSVLRGLVKKGHGVTSNRVRSLIRQIFNFGIAEDRLAINPIAKVRATGTETASARVLADAEIRQVWLALVDPSGLHKPPPQGKVEGPRVYIGPALSIGLRLLLLTLVRRGELAGMRTDEVDLAQATWSIPGARTKNGRPLSVPLSPAAVLLIRAAIKIDADKLDDGAAPSPFVFPSPRDRNKPVTPESVSHALRDLCLALGADRFTPHDLRRTAATIMASERLRITPFLIGRILNHTTETGGAAAVTLQHYAIHEFAEEKREAMDRWAHLLGEIVMALPADR